LDIEHPSNSKVIKVEFVGTTNAFVSSEDGVGSYWSFDLEAKTWTKISNFKECYHRVIPAIGEFLILSQLTNYEVYSLNEGTKIAESDKSSIVSPITSLAIHPDGIILATGHKDGKLIIWDIWEQKIFKTIDVFQDSSIEGISFSHKGIHISLFNSIG